MSVYNDSKNIGNSIESILNQDFKDFEFLIMDDGSTDESYEIIDIYSKDTRVKVFKNNENLGLQSHLIYYWRLLRELLLLDKTQMI